MLTNSGRVFRTCSDKRQRSVEPIYRQSKPLHIPEELSQIQFQLFWFAVPLTSARGCMLPPCWKENLKRFLINGYPTCNYQSYE